MAEKEAITGDFPWLPLIGLIVVGGGVLLLMPQITSSRPGGGNPRLAASFEPQAINARLWQDPFGVVVADQERDKEKPTNGQAHSIEILQKLLVAKCFTTSATRPLSREQVFVESAERFQICAVMIPGGPYVEDVERRLRARRAVIEGLGEAGYGPEKDHELSYICLPWQPLAENAAASVLMLEKERARCEKSASPTSQGIEPVRRNLTLPNAPNLLVPYEWYERESFHSDTKPDSHILVLWLNDDAFVDAPLARLADLISWFRLRFYGDLGSAHFGNALLPAIHFAVLGPDNSGTLHKMVLEAEDNSWSEKTRQCLAMTHIYSSQAGAADALLMAGMPSQFPDCKTFIENAVKSGGHAASAFVFERTLPLDDLVVKALWKEIEKRRLTDKDHVAIISELDSYYARALSASFIKARAKMNDRIESYSYLRGIDGKLPSDQKEKELPPAAEKSDKKTETSSRPTEQTEGLNQADDIRRLANELQERDHWLQLNGGGRLKAVGLLGSDVYDKLELLKALRPALPEAVFFTNNLDARLAHPDEWSETHNLIVVSPFPVSLKGFEGVLPSRDHGQPKVPPFRDSGQTALFAATLDAFGKGLAKPELPYIFEVDHNGLKELKEPSRPQEAVISVFQRVALFVTLGTLLATWIWFVSRVAEEKEIQENKIAHHIQTA
jgi:hypothetical protein